VPEFLDDSIDFEAYLEDTEAQTKVKPAADFVDDAKARLRQKLSEPKTFLPWPKTNESFDFRPSEVTVWAGQNGHGKTDVTSQIALSLLGQGERVCIASFEMKPLVTIQRLIRMFSGTNPNAPEYQTDEGITPWKSFMMILVIGLSKRCGCTTKREPHDLKPYLAWLNIVHKSLK